jgi:hypothetical protein
MYFQEQQGKTQGKKMEKNQRQRAADSAQK